MAPSALAEGAFFMEISARFHRRRLADEENVSPADSV
jgi:hypothetical protein